MATQKPTPVEQDPQAGGSYTRQADGTLTPTSVPTQAQDAPVTSDTNTTQE
ncbi:MAG: hypothetical protein RL758_346 [Pseudomonadota bacterium]|jgi:hypothetical protein